MRLKQLTALFGRLDNETLTLHPGLNIIEAPNESGKSTWTAFLRVMLYGMNTRDRSPLADKRRYLPWSGRMPEGQMDLTCSLGEITVTRQTLHPGSPMGQFSAVYTGTNEPATALSAANCGETLTGVPQAIYERSAYIRQSGMAIDQDAALERRIAALITTGEEDTSYTDASQRLKQQLSRRARSHTGLLPQTEQEISALRRTLAELADLRQALIGCQEELEALTRQKEHLSRQLRQCREYERAQLLYRAQQAEYQAALAQSARYRQMQEQLQAHPFYPQKPEQLPAEPPASTPRPHAHWWLPCLCALPGASTMAAVIYLTENLPAAVGSGLGLTGTLLLIASALIRKKQDAWDLHKNAQLNHYQQSLEAYTILYNGVKQPHPPVPQPPTPPREPLSRVSPEALEHALREMEQQCSQAEQRQTALLHQLQSLGDPLSLEEQLERLLEQQSQLQVECDAITLASQVLERANTTLQQRFSPELGEKSAKIFTKLTQGKYNGVLLDHSMTPSAQEAGQFLPRAAAVLSQGAADQLYLAVRLAVCQMVLPQDDAPPILLDDALVTFDDRRCAAALDCLLELSQKQQILLFTCQKREAEYLRHHAAHPFHVINL